MAEFYTQFSCELDLGSADKAAAALDLLDRLRNDPDSDDPPCHFVADLAGTEKPGVISITDDEGTGVVEHVTAFVLACAEAFDLTGCWGFCWAMTCSKPCPETFGGGAETLDLSARKSLAWINTARWLDTMLGTAATLELKA